MRGLLHRVGQMSTSGRVFPVCVGFLISDSNLSVFHLLSDKLLRRSPFFAQFCGVKAESAIHRLTFPRVCWVYGYPMWCESVSYQSFPRVCGYYRNTVLLSPCYQVQSFKHSLNVSDLGRLGRCRFFTVYPSRGGNPINPPTLAVLVLILAGRNPFADY